MSCPVIARGSGAWSGGSPDQFESLAVRTSPDPSLGEPSRKHTRAVCAPPNEVVDHLAIEDRPTEWLVGCMNSVGIFEAKTKFTAICEDVARTRQAVVVSKRGKPMIMVAPIPAAVQFERPDILTAWRNWTEGRGAGKSDFPGDWKLRGRAMSNPLAG